MNGTERSVAQWVTLAGSCVILLVVVSLIAFQMRDPLTPPAPVATVGGDVREVEGQFHVVVDVHNAGDVTAANVQVSAELEIDGATSSADQTIDFLAGGEHVGLVFIFADDPATGTLTVAVTGYTEP